jgi:hypothetical protein
MNFREYKRFKGAKMASTGIDPHDGLKEFLKKDVIKNIDVHRDNTCRKDDLEARKDCISIGTAKRFPNRVGAHSVSEGNLDYGVVPRFQRLCTDHISFEPPENERTFQRVFDKMMIKAPYAGNWQSKAGWKPVEGHQTVNNRSSVKHDIINFQTNPRAGIKILNTLDTKITNRKKGLAEFTDKTRVTALKINQDHLNAYNENPKVFHRKTGIFSHMYDASARNGNLSMPFK